MSPIFVRPVREQLEHDRLVRHLGAKFKRKYEVGLNVGDEQVAPVKLGSGTFFPDVVLTDGRRLAGLIEVETAESVNNLEAMAQWVHFARSRAPFSLYVPMAAHDVARRLCEANGARVAEIWAYRAMPDGFDLIRMFHDAARLAAASKAAAATKAAARSRPKKAAASKRKTAKAAKPKAAKASARKAKAKTKAKAPRKSAKKRVTKKPARASKAAGSKKKAAPRVKKVAKASARTKSSKAVSAARVQSLKRAAARASQARDRKPARKR